MVEDGRRVSDRVARLRMVGQPGRGEQPFGVLREQHPQSVQTDERPERDHHQPDDGDHDPGDARPRAKPQQPDADDQARQGRRQQKHDEGHAGQPDDRDRDRRLGIAARADDARRAAKHHDQQHRHQQTDGAERNLERAEYLDMRIHGGNFTRFELTCPGDGSLAQGTIGPCQQRTSSRLNRKLSGAPPPSGGSAGATGSIATAATSLSGSAMPPA